MTDGPFLRITEGDKVRVHYHPPGRVSSFVEGVVRRTEVSTLRGRVFVVDVTSEVVLDRKQLVKPGYQNYVLYERWEEFPGRIEVLTEAETDGEDEMMPAFDAEADRSEIESQDGRSRGSLIASIFGRQK